MSVRKGILIGLVIILLLIQFVRPNKSSSSPDVSIGKITYNLKASTEVATILKTSCYDCHSSNIYYPWYANIMPVGWLINHHIEDGKKHFNFDSLNTYSPEKRSHKIEELIEEVEKHEMPLSIYTLLHREAQLSEQQITQIVRWANSL